MKYLLLLFSVISICGYAQDIPLTKLVPVQNHEAVSAKPRWSPPADYHRAAVIIRTEDSKQGSGVLIQHTGKGIVALTNRHVVRIGDDINNPVFTRVTLKSQNGNSFDMKVLATSIEYDLALLKSVSDEITAKVSLPLGNFEVPHGADIELVGFGGPGSELRHFYGSRLASLEIDAITISGDSGSPMIYGGAVIGVNYGGSDIVKTVRTPNDGNWNLIYPASSRVVGPILCQWVNAQCYQYGQCQPYIINEPVYGPQGSPPPQGGYEFYPPQGQRVPQDQSIGTPPPPVLNQPTNPTPTDSPSQELIDKVVEQVLADPRLSRESLKGEKGDTGPEGPQGPQGLQGPEGSSSNTEEIQAQLTLIRQQVNDLASMIPSQQPPIDQEALINEVINRIPGCQCQDDTAPAPTENLGEPDRPVSSKYLESNRVLYFTANSCTNCFEVTNMVNSLKRSGYPITIITLTTSMAEAHQVPQVFVPATGVRATGPTNVKEFLSKISL